MQEVDLLDEMQYSNSMAMNNVEFELNCNYQQGPMQYNQMNNFQLNCNYADGPQFIEAGDDSMRLLKEKEKDKKVVAIIVSFVNSCSYDELFTSIEQKTLEGCQTLVYACGANRVKAMNKAFEEPSEE